MVFGVCPECGMFDVERRIEPEEGSWAVAICSTCGAGFRFLRLPLFVLTGPSGAGKTTVCLDLLHTLPEGVVLESDILWGAIEANPDDGYQAYRSAWLRVVKNVHQAGRPVLLGGTALPDQIEHLPERRYIGEIHYLALVCDDDELAARLRARPAWRNAGHDEFVTTMVGFNRWLKENAGKTSPPMTLLDTSRQTREKTAAAVATWFRERLPQR